MADYTKEFTSSGTSRLTADTRDKIYAETPRHTVAMQLGYDPVLVSSELAEAIYSIAMNNVGLPEGSVVKIPVNGKVYSLTQPQLQYIVDTYDDFAPESAT